MLNEQTLIRFKEQFVSTRKIKICKNNFGQEVCHPAFGRNSECKKPSSALAPPWLGQL
jgi:hypothetical protein